MFAANLSLPSKNSLRQLEPSDDAPNVISHTERLLLLAAGVAQAVVLAAGVAQAVVLAAGVAQAVVLAAGVAQAVVLAAGVAQALFSPFVCMTSFTAEITPGQSAEKNNFYSYSMILIYF